MEIVLVVWGSLLVGIFGWGVDDIRQRLKKVQVTLEEFIRASMNRARDLTTAVRKISAEKFGYFWLPCPCCGEMFAGFETGKRSVPADTPGQFRVCCKWCDE